MTRRTDRRGSSDAAAWAEVGRLDPQSLAEQLFMVDFAGPEPSPDVERLVTEGGVGGVVLFGKNVEHPGQVARLTNALQHLAAGAGRPPLLVAVDQEGGPVVRLGTQFPAAMAFGAADDAALVTQAASVTARELRAAGIHINFAPVLDVNSNAANPVIGVRSYGEDPGRVAALGVAAITGMQAEHVLATAKHFPGHGDTALDSHLALPVVRHARSHLDAVELRPFREAVRAGVAAVMTAHIVYPALDPEAPATLSAPIITLLRNELGFGGLVVSDSMQMRAIADRLPPGDAAVRAVRAGVDVVLALGPTDALWEALHAVRAACGRGEIPAPRVHDAAGRILAAKRRLGLFEHALVSEPAAARDVGSADHRRLADRVADAAVTVVRDPAGAIPVASGPIFVATDLAGREIADRLVTALGAAGRVATAVAVDAIAASAPPGSAPAAVVVPIGRTIANDSAAAIRRVTLEASRTGPTVVVALDVPYPLASAGPACACLAAYGTDPSSLRAVTGALTGTIRPRGHLSVTVAQPA